MNRKRKRTSTAEAELEKSKSSRQEAKTSEEEEEEEAAQETPGGRPSRNRRKSAKLAEAEGNARAPQAEPQRLGVISLHHEKGGRKDAEDSWTITSSTKPSRKSAPAAAASKKEDETQEEEGQLLHVVSKGKRQQTIKIKPLHKPEPSEDEKTPTEKPTASRHSKKSHQKALPPISLHGDSNISVKEESGIKLKLILSPKDKGKSAPEAETSKGVEDKRSTSREKSGRSSSKDKDEHVKAKLVFGDQVLRLDGDKVISQSQKRKREEPVAEQPSDVLDSSKGNKRKRTSQAEAQETPKTSRKPSEESKSATKVDKKAETSDNRASAGSTKASQKTPDRSGQGKAESKSKTKAKAPTEANSQSSSDASKDEDKSKKKKPKENRATANYNLLSVDESIDDLVIDESKIKESPKKPKVIKTKVDKKKKKPSESDSSHKSKKHKSKDAPKKHRAKFITTGTKKPGRSVGLDPVTASHMFGQFDSATAPAPQQPCLDLKGPSPGLDDESFFMAGSEVTTPPFSSETELMGLPGLGFLGAEGKTKKMSKKSSRKGDREKKKKKKKGKLKKGGKAQPAKEKKPLSAYMLWCAQTRRDVVSKNPGLDFSGISKMMGTLWQQLPEKEKLAWYSKQRMQSIKHKNVPSLSKQKLRRSSSGSGRGSRSPRGSPVRHFMPRTEPIDCAAHLKLLGESLAMVGDRLQNHVGQVEVHGSLSVLLDSTLCALAPLMSLTSQVPQLNSIKKETIAATLDNIAYIMPGLG